MKVETEAAIQLPVPLTSIGTFPLAASGGTVLCPLQIWDSHNIIKVGLTMLSQRHLIARGFTG